MIHQAGAPLGLNTWPWFAPYQLDVTSGILEYTGGSVEFLHHYVLMVEPAQELYYGGRPEFLVTRLYPLVGILSLESITLGMGLYKGKEPYSLVETMAGLSMEGITKEPTLMSISELFVK